MLQNQKCNTTTIPKIALIVTECKEQIRFKVRGNQNFFKRLQVSRRMHDKVFSVLNPLTVDLFKDILCQS